MPSPIPHRRRAELSALPLRRLGDIAGDAPTEIALGAAGGARAGAVHIASPCANRVLKTDPRSLQRGRWRASASRSRRSATATATASSTSRWAPRCPPAARAASTSLRAADRPAPGFAGCGPSSNPGPGGGSNLRQPARGTVRARVLRRLALVPSKRRLKRGSALRLSGSLKASAGQASCQRRQKIAIQRRKAERRPLPDLRGRGHRQDRQLPGLRRGPAAPICTARGCPRRPAAWAPRRSPRRSSFARRRRAAAPVAERRRGPWNWTEKPLYMRLCLWYPRFTRDALGGGIGHR